MNLDLSSIVVNYPNSFGDTGRYELKDQRAYFKQFDYGVSHLFYIALRNTLSGDLLSYSDECNEYFDIHYDALFSNNAISLEQYQENRKEFNRRIFDIYRYARTSLKTLGEDLPYSHVDMLSYDDTYHTASFILK